MYQAVGEIGKVRLFSISIAKRPMRTVPLKQKAREHIWTHPVCEGFLAFDKKWLKTAVIYPYMDSSVCKGNFCIDATILVPAVIYPASCESIIMYDSVP